MIWLALVVLIAVFTALHVVPLRPEWRGRLATALGGETPYKLAFMLLSAIGLFGAFAVAGRAPVVSLWSAGEALRGLALVATALAAVLLGAAYGPGKGNRLARHPMLAGIALWAGAHALASGELAYLLVFGSLTAYAIVAMPLSDARQAARDAEAASAVARETALVPFWWLATGGARDGLRWQGPAVALVAWVVLLLAHGWLFGASPWPATGSG